MKTPTKSFLTTGDTSNSPSSPRTTRKIQLANRGNKRRTSIIIKNKKESYGYDIIRERVDATSSLTWGSLSISMRNKNSVVRANTENPERRSDSYTSHIFAPSGNEQDQDDEMLENNSLARGEKFGVTSRFNRMVKNEKGEEKLIPLVLMPDSTFKHRWDVFIMMLLSWVAIVTPIQISYLSDFQRLDNVNEWLFYFVIDRIIDFAFVIDMFISARTAWFNEHGDQTFDDIEAVKKYLKGYFLIDFLSIFPFQLLLSSPGKLTRLFKLVRLVKMVRLLKVSKFYGAVEKQAGLSIGYSNIRMVILLIFILLIAHWMACALFIIYAFSDVGDLTWVEAHGTINSESSRVDIYLVAYYWAIMTRLNWC